MSASEALAAVRFVQPFVYGGVALLALVHWRRHRGPASAWLTAAFGILTLVLVNSVVPDDALGELEAWVGKLSLALIVLFPYCLYRFMDSFVRPVRRIQIMAAAATAAIGLTALLLPDLPPSGAPRPAWYQGFITALLVQWVSLLGLVAVRLWRAGKGEPSVARRRMRTMSLGAVGLALALVVAGEASRTPTTRLIVQLLALAAAPLMLIGFAPPYPLRMWWRRADDDRLLETESRLIEAETTEQVAQVLLPSARMLLGARGATLESLDGKVVATEGEHAAGSDELGQGDGDGSPSRDARSLLRIPMRSHRLTILVTPFTTFFAEEELKRMEVLAGVAELTLGRQALLDEQRRLAAVVESSHDAILAKTLDGIIVAWNRGAEELYGYTAEEIVGKSVKLLLLPDQRHEVDQILDRIKRGEAIRHFESKRVRKDGTQVDVSLTISPIKDGDGSIIGASAIARDITQAVAWRAELAEQADMLDLAQDAIIARRLDAVITYWNIAAEELYGYSKVEALGRTSHELLQTSFPAPAEEIEAELAREGRWEGELSHSTRGGDQVVTWSKWALRRDEEGTPFQVLEVNNDITARKAAQEALVEREAMLAAIFETSPDIIATITSSLQLTYVNPAARHILGYEFEELFGRDSLHWVHPEDIEVATGLLQAAFGAGETTGSRLRVKSAAGEWIWLDIRMRRMTSDADAAVVLARDVSDQVRLEEDLHQAKQVADEANLAKSEFLSRMSHELRTPLNAILGFGQLLELDDLTADQRESTELIIKGGQRLLQLINEVLDISRIEAGTLQLSLEPVQVGAVVRDAIELIRPLADARPVRLRMEISPDMEQRHVIADQQRLGQILLNLLSNAVKYNVEKGTVSMTAIPGDGGTIRIGVTDTGPGISDEKIPLLFAPFERLGAEQSSIEGTGLGLALSKSLLEAMGGRVNVDTMRGQGTTFWIELRGSDSATANGDAARDSEARRSHAPKGKLLYIEDNLSNLRLIERLMSHHEDIELISAMTGALGLDLAQQHLPEIILLDLHLPDLRGEEVLIRLRKDARTRAIPVVILSADATPGQIERLRAAGANEYVTKPLDVVEFLGIIGRLLGSPAGGQQPTTP